MQDLLLSNGLGVCNRIEHIVITLVVKVLHSDWAFDFIHFLGFFWVFLFSIVLLEVYLDECAFFHSLVPAPELVFVLYDHDQFLVEVYLLLM